MEIYISEFNPINNSHVIIQGDSHSIWAYSINHQNEIEFDGFICSRGILYLAVFALQTTFIFTSLIFRSFDYLGIRKPINF